MHLRRLELVDVRSYDRARLDLEPGVTVLVGRNAQGKTNLLEAVLRAATGRLAPGRVRRAARPGRRRRRDHPAAS